MALTEPILSTAPVNGIAEPHQSTVAGILRAVGQGLFTAAEAEELIDRMRAHVAVLPVTLLSVEGGAPHSPDRTVS